LGELPRGIPSNHYSHRNKSSKKTDHNLPLLKLDVKFEFSTYDGELNANKLDNWIKKIKVNCRVQRIMDEVAKIQLVSLQLSGTALIWWESKMQVDMVQNGKVISSWDKFIKAIRKQVYPLADTQMTMIEWQHLRLGKGWNIQEYTHEFKRKKLSLGISLYTHENILKYIGGMHSYLRHTILMFSPTSIDKVLVQDTHIESSKGKHASEDKNPYKFEKKLKGKWKSKKSAIVKQVEGRPTCSHYKIKGHEELMEEHRQQSTSRGQQGALVHILKKFKF
jgi:hypothetical protein